MPAPRATPDAPIITYAIVDSPVGRLLVGRTERGLATIRLGASDGELGLRADHPHTDPRQHGATLSAWVNALLRHLDGEPLALHAPLDVSATPFQRRIWRALRAIPYGATRSYGDIAAETGRAAAARAVARACAANPLALVIPCHRVIQSDGGVGGYRWGRERKRLLLERERQALQAGTCATVREGRVRPQGVTTP